MKKFLFLLLTALLCLNHVRADLSSRILKEGMHDEDSVIIKLIIKNFTCEAKGFWIINDSTVKLNPSLYRDKRFLRVADSVTLYNLSMRNRIENKKCHIINYSSD